MTILQRQFINDTKGIPIGVLVVDNALSGRPISDKHREILTLYASELSALWTWRAAEQTHREFEHLCRDAIINVQGVPYRLTFSTGCYDLVGSNCQEIVGIPAKDLSFERWKELTRELNVLDEGYGSHDAYRSAYREGKIRRYRVDVRIETPAGEEKWLTDCAVPFVDRDSNEIIGSLGILLDVTERKRNERRLKELLAEMERTHVVYRDAIELADGIPYEKRFRPDGADARYEVMGHGCEEIFEIRSKEFTPEHWNEMSKETKILDPSAPKTVPEYTQAFLRGEVQNYRVEVRIETPSGKVKWVTDSSVPITNGKGEVIGAIGILQDITARKRVEQELARSNAELLDFAYKVSHELLQPVRDLTYFGESFLRRHREEVVKSLGSELSQVHDPRVLRGKGEVEDLWFIDSATGRIERLASDLLEYSRVSKQELSCENVDLNRVLGQVERDLAALIDERGATIRKIGSLPTVTGSSVLLGILMKNLLENGIKFCHNEPKLEIGGVEVNQGYGISVRDNGIGFPPEQADRIFNVFTKLNTRDKYAGEGMGLTLCKKIVERHGGRIWAESSVAVGSVFHFWLPGGKNDSAK